MAPTRKTVIMIAETPEKLRIHYLDGSMDELNKMSPDFFIRLEEIRKAIDDPKEIFKRHTKKYYELGGRKV